MDKNKIVINDERITSLHKNEKETLIKEYIHKIEELSVDVYVSYYKIGKLLNTIKKHKLYEYLPNCNSWVDFCHTLSDVISLITIKDIILIVETYNNNPTIYDEEEFLILNFHQAKKLINSYNIISKVVTPAIRQKLVKDYKEKFKNKIKTYYNQKAIELETNLVEKPVIEAVEQKLLEYNSPEYRVLYDPKQNILQVHGENGKIRQLFEYFNTKSFALTKEENHEIHVTPYVNKPKILKTSNNVELHELAHFVSNIPKTEIHLHLEALISVSTLFNQINKYNLKYKPSIDKAEKHLKSIKDVEAIFKVTSLPEFINLFLFIQSCFKSEEDFSLLVSDSRNYMKKNNIFYAEIFFAPTSLIRSGLSFETLLEILDDNIKRIQQEDGIDIRFIVDVSRTFGPENAMNNLNLVLKNPYNWILGIGLGGDEKKGPAIDFVNVFEKARANGLHVVAHAGEDVGPESIWDSLLKLKAERIGHGITAIYDNALMDYLKEHQIPLEVCPTSNVFTQKYVKKLSEHPIKKFYDYGLLVTLNTDDPTIFNVNLNQEYINLAIHLDFTLEQLIQLVFNNLKATFLEPKEKKLCEEFLVQKINDLLVQQNIAVGDKLLIH